MLTTYDVGDPAPCLWQVQMLRK